MTSSSNFLRRLRDFSPELNLSSIALTDGSDSINYTDLAQRVASLKDWLIASQASTIALHGPNSIDWVLIDLACQEAELICIPIPDFFSASQIQHCIDDAGVDLVVASANPSTGNCTSGANTAPVQEIQISGLSKLHAFKLDRNQQPSACPIGTQKITFTSGSTGTPKGACLSSEHQWVTAKAIASTLKLHQPRHLCVMPLATLLENIAGVYAPLLCGGTIVLASDEDRGLSGSSGLIAEAFISCISNTRPNSMILIPQLLTVLLAASQKGWLAPSSLEFIAVGGAKVSPTLLQQSRMHSLPVYEGYGLSECGSVVALSTPTELKDNCVGKTLPQFQLKVLEDRSIVVQNPVFLGYLNNPNSWYPKQINTGDLGSMHDGFLRIEGRQKNILINSFGRNISPEWVESELCSKPLFSHCVVIGDNKPYLSALLSAGTETPDSQIENWISQVNSSLPDYAQVQRWLRLEQSIWASLSTANGRPQRNKIDVQLAERISQLYPAADSNSLLAASRISAAAQPSKQ